LSILPDDLTKLRSTLLAFVPALVIVSIDAAENYGLGHGCWSDVKGWVNVESASRYTALDLGLESDQREVAMDSIPSHVQRYGALSTETGIAVTEKLARAVCDAHLTAYELFVRYAGDEGEHPDIQKGDWRSAVANKGTTDGYWEWLSDKLENICGDFRAEVEAASADPAPG